MGVDHHTKIVLITGGWVKKKNSPIIGKYVSCGLLPHPTNLPTFFNLLSQALQCRAGRYIIHILMNFNIFFIGSSLFDPNTKAISMESTIEMKKIDLDTVFKR